jgi:hypothetical protein
MHLLEVSAPSPRQVRLPAQQPLACGLVVWPKIWALEKFLSFKIVLFKLKTMNFKKRKHFH